MMVGKEISQYLVKEQEPDSKIAAAPTQKMYESSDSALVVLR